MLAAALVLLAAATEPDIYHVTLWANDDSVETDPDVITTETHPCGASATVRLTRMPPYREDQGTLGTELVVESAADGLETARWSVPIDYQPLALRGRELLVNHRGRRLWIGTDGSLRADGAGANYPDPETASCPTPAAHPDSVYAQCAAFSDLDSGQPRLLQYEAPCT